jgi:formiminotetrahydrofolate cyclodeaminase
MPDSFLVDLAKPQPDPGGGAAAAHGALIGLALLEKVFKLEYARIQPNNPAIKIWEMKRDELHRLHNCILSLREEDRRIFPRLIKAKESEGKSEALMRIIEDSITVPLRIMKGTIEGLSLVSWVGVRCKKILKADLWVAAELLEAALLGAFHIGQANLPLVQGIPVTRDIEQELRQTLQEGMRTFNPIKEGLFSPSDPKSE